MPELDLPPVRSDVTPSPGNHAADHNKIRAALSTLNDAVAEVPPVIDATTTTKGVVELADSDETIDGEAEDKVVTPAGLKTVADPIRASVNPLGVYKPAGWGTMWRAARANSGSSLARVAVVGDSIQRGFYASNLDTKGYIGLLRQALQTAYGDGGSGFKGVMDTSVLSPAAYAAINYWTLSGTWNLATSSLLKNGPGGKAIQPSLTTDYAEAVVRGTIAEFFAIDTSSAFPLRPSIDGVAQTNIASSGAKAIFHPAYPGLAAGNHTLRVTNSVYLVGVSGRNTTGVVVDNYAVQGSTSGQWNNLDNLQAVTNVIDGGAGAWSGGYKRPCDLLIMGDILNDAAAGASYDQYLDYLKMFLDGVRGKTSGAAGGFGQIGDQDILIVLPHAGRFDNATTSRHMQMAKNARDLAEQYGAALVNFWTLGRNSWDYWNSLGYWSDDTTASGLAGTGAAHPSNAGHQYMYDTLVAAIPELLG